jgi:hypothetical protein
LNTEDEPVLTPVAIKDLRPTQIAIGMREVALKRRDIRKKDGKIGSYLGNHMIPVVLGPKGRHYVIDHHHLARALLEEDIESVLVTVVSDLSKLSKDSFLFVLDTRGWMHPFDSDGVRRSYDSIPKRIADLTDDPFRSLASELRRQGGYAKDTTPYSEFLWADFLRRRITTAALKDSFDSALEKAFALSKQKDADYLPGWCGLDPI